MIYVMSDLHGRYLEFLSMLKKINLKNEDTLYILGDIIDRRPNSIKLLKYIMNKNNIKVIKGNHEFMMESSIFIEENALEDNRQMIKCWKENGGIITKEEFDKESESSKKEILEYIKSLKEFKIIEVNNQKYLLIHAGLYIPENKKIPEDILLEELLKINIEREYNYWIREDFLDVNEYLKDYIILFGHTPTRYIPQFTGYITKPMSLENKKRCLQDKIYITKHKIGIDCEEHLACLRLNDMKEFYVYSWEELNEE